jgi:hypothetical protein
MKLFSHHYKLEYITNGHSLQIIPNIQAARQTVQNCLIPAVDFQPQTFCSKIQIWLKILDSC